MMKLPSWPAEGCQHDRDQEYWLKAEQQLRAISQQKIDPAKDTSAKRKSNVGNSKKGTM